MHPWWLETDCTLAPTTVQALVAAQAPELDAAGARYLDEGWDSWTFSARGPGGSDWILRFPKRAEVARRLAREVALLPALAARLPLAVPRFEVFGVPALGYPHAFVGYRRLPGVTAIALPLEGLDAAALGDALGAFLAALHESPAPDGDEDGADDAKDGAATALQRLDAFTLPDRVRARVRELLDAAPAPRAYGRCLVHSDFFPEHLVVDGGRVTGVIDWGDLERGDPATDLAGLVHWMGEPMLAAGLARYGRARRLDAGALAGLAARARRRAVCRAVEDMTYGAKAGRDEYLRSGLRSLELL
jgi:aminoglycoside phosphotransferase (APT) family kinase protein